MHEHVPESSSRQTGGVEDRQAGAAAVSADPASARLLALQSSAGNAAVAGLLQPSLVVGASSDPLEHEADRVAAEVSRSPGSPAGSARKVRGARAAASRATASDAPPGGGPAGPAGGPVDDGFTRDLTQARGGGQPLPGELRATMELSFGSDFAGVRVHEGPDAAGMADAIGARAFTTGSDIFLGSASPALDTDAGTHLLAHELTHVVQQSGGADGTLRRDDRVPGAPPDGAPPDGAPQGRTFTLLEVAERLVEDLSAHKRGFLIDLKPKTLITEVAKIKAQLDKLTARSTELQAEIALLGKSAELKRRYDRTVKQYDDLKNLGGWFVSSTPLYKELNARKHAIEDEFGVRGRDKLTKAMEQLSAREAEITEELERTTTVIARTEALILEIQDRAIAFGVSLEEHAKEAGYDDAEFPFETDTPTQLAWIETWSQKLPGVLKSVGKHLAETEQALAEAEEVRNTEASYAFHELSHKKLVKEYAYLAQPGASSSQSLKIAYSVGTGVEFGFFVQVSGSVATGDDRKVRPSFSLKVGASAKIDVGVWALTGSVGLTYSFTETYDSLEHFAAHYMRVLSLYNGSFQRYAQLQGRLDAIPKNAKDYAEQRKRVIAEARSRGFVDEGDTVEVGNEEQRKLAELQERSGTKVHALSVDVGFSAEPNDNMKGFGEYLGGFNFSASYTKKWFSRLVDYDEFVAANGDVDGELARLQKIKTDYLALIRQLEKARRDLELGAFGIAPPEWIEREKELSRLKNVYEEGHLTFFRRGRKQFLQELDDRIAALQKQEDEDETVDGVEVDDLRAVPKKAKKELKKSGSVQEVVIDGSFKIGGLGVTLAGKYNKIVNDANADNDGIYLNFSLEGATDITVEALDPASDAGKKALEKIAEAGTFSLEAVEPTASAVTATFVKNLGGLESVTGALAGGVKLEGNLVWKHGSFVTQYVRVTRSRSVDLSIKAPVGPGTLETSYSGGRTDFVAEWVGTNTFSYVQTVYNGLKAHPDFDKEWKAFVAEHRESLWKLMVGSLTYTTNARDELLELPDGKTIWRTYFEDMSSLRHLAGMDKPPPVNKKMFADYLGSLERSFDKDLETRASLKIEDLKGSGWSSAEGSVDSEVTQVFTLGTLTPVGKPKVASKSGLTKAVKGKTTSVDDFSRYGSYSNLLDAGAMVRLRFETDGTKLTVEFDPTVDFTKALEDATKALLAWASEESKAKLTTYAGTENLTAAARRYLDDLMRAPIAA